MKNNLIETNRFRGFKVETINATNTKPVRVKITDLRYNKKVLLSYGAKHDNFNDLLQDFFNSKNILIEAQTWAEDSSSKHLYNIYLTENFDTQIN